MEAYRDNETKEGLRRDVTWGLGSEAPYVLYKGNQMRGHTLGVIGYGSIGREVAKLCQAFEMRILAYDPFVSQNNAGEGVRMVEMEELLREADIVTIHCKDTPKTNGLIDAAAFSKMKKNAVFINTARGALVDEKALIQALREKQIAGAALDVFDQEPLTKDHPFVAELDNVVITPHLAGATYEAIDNHTRQLISDVKHFITGEPLEYEYR
jgi:D-3-phosphoglycerate dehydrogenase